MKKRLKPIIITIAVLAALTAGAYFLLNRGGGRSSQFAGRIDSEQSDQGEDRAYTFDINNVAIELRLTGDGKNVLNFDSTPVYDVKTSREARERLDRVLRKSDVSFDEPLIAANPFGTNENSFYFYFTTEYRGMVRYTITVEDDTIPDHVRYVNNGQENNLTMTHECVVSGLVPGMMNYIIIEVLDSSGAGRGKKVFKYTPPEAKLSTKIAAERGKSKEICENGLFFLLPKAEKDIYVYDNSGILRDVVVTESGHGKRFFQAGDSVIYQVSDTKFARVSALGMVMATAEVKGYGEIRDFGYDGYDNIYCLVSKKGRDRIISVSISTGKSKSVYEFPKGMTNSSMALTAGSSAYFACDKPKGIVRVEALASNRPQIAYVLGDKDAWKSLVKKNPELKKKVKKEKTVLQWDTSGAVLHMTEESADGNSDMLSTYLPVRGKGCGLGFILDSKEKKISEKSNFPTGQSGRMDGFSYGPHFLITELDRGIYTEYDKDGKVTKEFSLGQPLDGMEKLTLNQMCFYRGN